MVNDSRKSKLWLRRLGLAAGVAGLIWLVIWGLFNYEGGPSWIAIAPLSVYVLPFLAGIIIAWNRPLVGGIWLIAIAIFWPAIDFAELAERQTTFVLSHLVHIMPVYLPQLITGILFLLSYESRKRETNKVGDV